MNQITAHKIIENILNQYLYDYEYPKEMANEILKDLSNAGYLK